MKTAFVLGGSGFVGRHVARRLADEGWDVTVASRGETQIPQEVSALRHVSVDRSVAGRLESAMSEGFDVLVDVIPYEIDDALQLVGVGENVGGIVAISTASVYADDHGRTMDEATREDDAPRMPIPIPETQGRADPGDATYSTKKVAIEDILLSQSDVPVSIIRPCAIYGPGDRQCREWFFVKRALDKRSFVLLADEGESIFHTTSVHNLAELVRLAAENPTTGAFNCGDPDPPNVRRIAETIAGVMGHEWDEVLLARESSRDWKTRNPWAGFHPWIVSMDRAHEQLSYEPVATYNSAIVETVKWVVSAVDGRDWREVLPKAAKYFGAMFDYEAEDALVAGR